MRAADLRVSTAAALGFVASAALTIAWCRSMSAMPGMSMPGGWTMSMAWMRMPGQGWPGAAATFVGMWTVMMIAMMLPVLAPTLWRERREPRAVALLAGGYFATWLALGCGLFVAGVAFAQIAMRFEIVSRLVPTATAVVLIGAGAWQMSRWKVRALRCCRARGDGCSSDCGGGAGAWRRGVALGAHCVRCCAPWTAVLLVLGVMDLAAMALVSVAIALERLLPFGERVARVAGLASLACGALLTCR